MLTKPGRVGVIPLAMLVLISAGGAVAQTAPPTTAEPVRGLEALQSDTTAPIPVPATPTLVLPGEPRTTRGTDAPRQPRPSAPADRPRRETETSRSARDGRPADTGRDRGRSADAPETPANIVRADPNAGRSNVAVSRPAPAAQQESGVTSPTPSAVPSAVLPPAEPVDRSPTIASAPETVRSMPFWLWLVVIPLVVGVLWLLRRQPRAARLADQSSVPAPTFSPEPDMTPAPVQGGEQPIGGTVVAAIPASTAEPVILTPPPLATEATAAPRFLEPREPEPARARARLTVELRPLRAGLNLLSATAECQVIVTNAGTKPAEGIRVHATLLTAHAGQDADLAAINAAPVSRPATAAFTLAPGEARVIRSVSAVARDAIHSMTAAGRPMFVPIVAVNILYATGATTAQTARAWAIGVERVDSAKLAPFWLDAPARMYDGIAARPHAVAVDR